MKVYFVTREQRLARCENGEFYDCGPPDNWEFENEIRSTAIEALRDFIGEDENTFVSDFVNGPRLLFVDLEMPGLTWDRLGQLRAWVAQDKHDHGILVGIPLTKEQDDYDSFLVTKSVLLFDDAFLALPWLVTAARNLNDS